jgi:hypothetical protein
MLVLHAIVNAIVLLPIPLLLALLLFKVRVRLVAPLRWFTLPQYAKVFIRLFAAVVMWVFLISVCVLYSFIHPSDLAYAALALVVLWYFYIPFFFAVVSIAWFTTEKLAERRRGKYGVGDVPKPKLT